MTPAEHDDDIKARMRDAEKTGRENRERIVKIETELKTLRDLAEQNSQVHEQMLDGLNKLVLADERWKGVQKVMLVIVGLLAPVGAAVVSYFLPLGLSKLFHFGSN